MAGVVVTKSRGGAAFLRVHPNVARAAAAARNRPRNPRELRELAAKHPTQFILGGTGAAAAGAVGTQHPSLDRKRSAQRQHGYDVGTGAVLGGAAGQAGWYGHGFRTRAMGHALERDRPDWMSRTKHQAVMRAHNKKHGVASNTKPPKAVQVAYYRDYPIGLPATKYKHRLGAMSGRKGLAMQLGLVGGTAMTGAAVAHGVNRTRVRKAFYEREEHLSPLRATAFAGGAALSLYGLGNSRFVGRQLVRGIKVAEHDGNLRSADALRRAQAAQGSIRRGMAPGEAAVRRIRAVNDAIDLVPKRIRGEVALAAGLLLGSRATPIHHTRYVPVNGPGW